MNQKSAKKGKYTDVNAQKKIKDFVEGELDLSYHDEWYDSPSNYKKATTKVLSRGSHSKEGKHKETESIVPPLSLKNIGANKGTQQTNTGKLTRTTMHSTQIRDKLPLNNLKNNVSSGIQNQKSNGDCK